MGESGSEGGAVDAVPEETARCSGVAVDDSAEAAFHERGEEGSDGG